MEGFLGFLCWFVFWVDFHLCGRMALIIFLWGCEVCWWGSGWAGVVGGGEGGIGGWGGEGGRGRGGGGGG